MKYIIALILVNILFVNCFAENNPVNSEAENGSEIIKHASTLFESQQYKDSETVLEQLLEQNKHNKIIRNAAFILLARIAIEKEQLDRAEDLFETSLNVLPNTAEEYYWFARKSSKQASNASIFTAMGYATDAKDGFKKAIELDKTYLPAHIGLFNYYLSAPSIAGGSSDKAKQQIANIESLSINDGAQARLKWLQENELTDDIKAFASLVLSNNKYDAKTQFQAASALVASNYFNLGLKGFRQVSTLAVAEQNQLYVYASYYQIGRTSVVGNLDSKTGIDAFQHYLKIFPNLEPMITEKLPSEHWAQFRMSQLLERSGEINKANNIINHLKSQPLNDPQLVNALHNR